MEESRARTTGGRLVAGAEVRVSGVLAGVCRAIVVARRRVLGFHALPVSADDDAAHDSRGFAVHRRDDRSRTRTILDWRGGSGVHPVWQVLTGFRTCDVFRRWLARHGVRVERHPTPTNCERLWLPSRRSPRSAR